MDTIFFKAWQFFNSKKSLYFLLFSIVLILAIPLHHATASNGVDLTDCTTHPDVDATTCDLCNKACDRPRGWPDGFYTQDDFNRCWATCSPNYATGRPATTMKCGDYASGLGPDLDPFKAAGLTPPALQTACQTCNARCSYLVVPLKTHTQGEFLTCWNGCMKGETDVTIGGIPRSSTAGAVATTVVSAADKIAEAGNQISSALSVGQVIQTLLVYVITLPGKLFGWVGWVIAYAAQKLLNWIIDFMLSIKITNCTGVSNTNPTVVATITNTCQSLQVSWAVVRDWADMLIVLGIIMVAMATIINFERYNAQHWLPKLLLVALLVNFSGVFVGFMVDVSNIATRQFLSSNDGGEGTIITALDQNFTSADTQVAFLSIDSKKSWSAIIGQALLYGQAYTMLGFIYLCTGVAYLYTAGILFARYAILAFLFILSPLAFVFFVFPIEKAKGLWNEWWSKFIKWCFVGVGSGFTIYLAGTIVKVSDLAKNVTFNFSQPWGISDLLKTVFVGYIPIFIALMFLYVGNKTAVKTATKVVGAIMGIATTATAAVLSGGTSLLGGLTSLAGQIPGMGKPIRKAKDVAQKMSSGAKWAWERSKETIYPELAGQANANWRKRQMKRLEPMKEGYAELSKTHEGRQKLAKIQQTGTRDQRVAATMALNDAKGGLGYLNKNKDAAIKEAISYGVYGKDIVKDPDDAHLDEEAIQNITAKRVLGKSKSLGRKLTATEVATERSGAINDHRKKLYESYRVENIEGKTDDEVIKKAEGKGAEAARYLEEAVKRGIIKKVTDYGNKLQQAKIDFGSNALDRAPAVAHSTAKFNAARVTEIRGAGIPGVATLADAQKFAEKEQLIENVSRASHRYLRGLDISDLTPDVVERMSPGQIKAYQTAPLPVRAHLKGPTVAGALTIRAGTVTTKQEKARLNNIIDAIAALP